MGVAGKVKVIVLAGPPTARPRPAGLPKGKASPES